MATAHEIAVITNSCVRAPVGPNAGLFTYNEDPDLRSTWSGNQREFQQDPKPNYKSVNFGVTQSVGPDLCNLSDSEFYERLVALKQEHKKTLELCERLYSDKLSQLKHAPQSENKNGMSTVSVSRDFTLSPNHSTEFESKKTNFLRGSFQADMSQSKPPTGRPQTADSVSRSRSKSKKSAWMTANGSPYGSQEEEVFRAAMMRGSDTENFLNAEEDLEHLNEALNDSKYSTLSKISEMWENFSVDDYAPHTRPRSASLSRLSSSNKKEEDKGKKEWRHRITIPKPFNMTLRDGSKTPIKTKAMIELEEKRERQERDNEAQCQKKFKAKPVPAHVYMPLYDEIVEEKETKRRLVKEHCEEVLTSQVKPFKFMQREEEKVKNRRVKKGTLDEYDQQNKVEFQASPYPAHIFDNTVIDKIKEEEEYRKLRMQMRSEELLKKSSLPPNMATRGQAYVDGKERQKLYVERAKKAGFTPDHKFKPKINPDMPNFDELHRQYMKEVAQRKGRKEATVCKPFNMRSERIQRKSNIYDDIENDRTAIQTNRYSFKEERRQNLLSTKTLSTSMDAIPAKMTKSSQLRQSANKEKLQYKIQNELMELEASRKKRLKEERLKKTINEKAMANDRTVTIMKDRSSKLKEYKESDRARHLEYKSQLNEMKERVGNRPMLFERTAQENAMKAADRKYKDTLYKAGLDEDFVNTKGRAASGSAFSGEVSGGEENEEESYMRSQSNRHSSSRQNGTRGYSDDYEKESEADRTQSDGDFQEEVA